MFSEGKSTSTTLLIESRVMAACAGKPLDDIRLLPEISILFMAGFESAHGCCLCSLTFPLPADALLHVCSFQSVKASVQARCTTMLTGDLPCLCSNRPHSSMDTVCGEPAPRNRGQAGG